MATSGIKPHPSYHIYMPAFNGGGAENAIIRLANHWLEQGINVKLIVNQSSGPLKSKLSANVPVITLGFKSSFANIPKLVRLLNTDTPDVLLTALLSPNVVGTIAARLSRETVPVVALVRNQATSELAEMPSWRSFIIRPMLKAAYRSADAIGCVATPVTKDVINLFKLDPNKVTETFNPIVLPDARDLIERPEYFPQNTTVILAIGRLVPQKDYFTVLEAFADLRKRTNAHLVVLGEGPLKSDLEIFAESLALSDHVTWAGFQTNPHAALFHSDLFVLLSKFEGFPNVIGEALACGATIVATDAPGGTADILANGLYGKLVPVGNHEAASQAMEAALLLPSDSQQQISRAKDFSIEVIAERYISLCTEAIKRRNNL
ncbi:glycosyltransferase [Phaeobacter sp. CNT1-3]|nr:glycosyltransferase [Phaeobacter sp. CNT1-3]